MTSTLPAPVVVGAQQPRISSVPPYVSSSGAEAVELCAMGGVFLDPWQQLVLTGGLGERPDGKWAAFEVGLPVPRQNGKDEILLARELTGMFLLGERLIIHSAHQFDTSIEHFQRLWAVIEGTPDFERRVQRVTRSHGEEGITLKGGQRIRFRTRTKGGGRGFTCDCLILNEAQMLAEMMMGALLPTLSTIENPQVWYAGSPVDQQIHPDGIVFARIRERGKRGGDPSLAYFEWSFDADHPDDVTPEMAADPLAIAQANPALGIRISLEYVTRERESMDARTFAVERGGVGDWPRTDGLGEVVIDGATWNSRLDEKSKAQGPVWFAFDVTPTRSRSTIGVAGRREDALSHVGLVEAGRGTGWLLERIPELKAKHSPARFICDSAGPAASLIPELEARGVKVVATNAAEMARACGVFYDAVIEGTLRHLGTPELAKAVGGAARRPLGDRWAWSRKTSTADISPLVAVTLALWALIGEDGPSVYEKRELLAFGAEPAVPVA